MPTGFVNFAVEDSINTYRCFFFVIYPFVYGHMIASFCFIINKPVADYGNNRQDCGDHRKIYPRQGG